MVLRLEDMGLKMGFSRAGRFGVNDRKPDSDLVCVAVLRSL